jgi:ring-1,2-phenylacetyl-CoA epoxidase subunit PaaD
VVSPVRTAAESGRPTPDAIRRILDEVMDPEVPVLSVVELGIVRKIEVLEEGVKITITPTYSGCPAIHAMEADMRGALEARGIEPVEFETVYAPPWTSDWIPDRAREKLRRFGIAPPGSAQEVAGTATAHLVQLTMTRRAPVECPFCGSDDTVLRSQFGSTACKAIHFCNACSQPFDEFKAI